MSMIEGMQPRYYQDHFKEKFELSEKDRENWPSLTDHILGKRTLRNVLGKFARTQRIAFVDLYYGIKGILFSSKK